MGIFKRYYKEIETCSYRNKMKLPPPIKGYKKYKNFLKNEIKNENDLHYFVVEYCSSTAYPTLDSCFEFFNLIEMHSERIQHICLCGTASYAVESVLCRDIHKMFGIN